MTPNRPKSAKKSGSRKSPAGATQTMLPQDPRSSFSLLSKHKIWTATALAAVIVVAIGLGYQLLNGSVRNMASASAATFVGSQTCAGCHRPEADLWRGSQHRHAMDHATEQSVVGDFSDTSFDYYGVRSRFFRKDGKFLVETDGSDGKLATFEVKYTFGVDPLQQYLIEFPDGRLQALSVAWDSRPKDQGGQRWFHLYPDEEIKHDDVLHWTKLNQNWNFMCAECHSTGVRKNYDAGRDRFATSFAEISVGCEACHGQGSRHVDWARARQGWWPFGKSEDPRKGLLVRFDERRDVVWPINPGTGNAARNFTPALVRKEVETCGLCHARRGAFSEDWVPGRSLSDTHVVSPLGRGLYHADGQMLDEVYNYGSFKQSKMFAAGVTCSDCHEPHGAKLRAPADGVCLQCHASDKYAAAAHHRHAGSIPPLTCASCHMPARTYMVIDRRHDHSFRVPRPDLSAKLGTPNACNDCHADKSAAWAASAIEGWHGTARKAFQTYAEAFHAARANQANAAALLAAVASDRNAPAFARASALGELASSSLALDHRSWRGRHCRTPTPLCGSARSTCSKAFPPTSSGRLFRRCSRTPIAGCASGPPRCWHRFRPRASLRPTANDTSAPRPSSSLRNASMPIVPKGAPHWETSSRGAISRALPRPSIGLRCTSARNMRRRRSTSPISTASSAATARARACCARQSTRHLATQGCIMLSDWRSLASSSLMPPLWSFVVRPSSSRTAHDTTTSTRLRCILLVATTTLSPS